MYAIVDIETTGGYAAANGITEISIHVFDGQKVVERFESLVNPLMPIPTYIRVMTGITNEMVEDAPVFEEIADKVYNILHDKVFVAHNVNFDYSFIKSQLEACGYHLNTRKLCTVRLSRKLMPGYPSYSLGNLCHSLLDQLAERGTLLIPLGGKDEQQLVSFQRRDGAITRRDIAPVRFVPLLGTHGWQA